MPSTKQPDPPVTAGLIGHVATLKVAGVICATILAGFALWALRHILVPLALAVFLLIMVDGMARAIRNHVKGFPEKLALPAAIGLIVAVLGLTLWFAADNASDFVTKLPVYTARIDALLGQGAQRLGLQVTPTAADLFHKFNPTHYAGDIARGASHAGEGTVFVLIYLGFLVASRQGFEAKTRELFPAEAERSEAARVFDRIRHGVERYIWVQTVVGLIITTLSAILMASVGLSHIAFWCLIIFLANYIPAIGAAIGVLFPAVFGLVELDGAWRVVVLLVGLEAVHFMVSHIVQPRLQGQNLNLDPIVVLLALAFWGLVWGVAGAFLSTPLTVLAMVVLAEFKGTRPIAVLLSSDGKPFGHAA
jgi:AI-2 transport protein TqsA